MIFAEKCEPHRDVFSVKKKYFVITITYNYK